MPLIDNPSNHALAARLGLVWWVPKSATQQFLASESDVQVQATLNVETKPKIEPKTKLKSKPESEKLDAAGNSSANHTQPKQLLSLDQANQALQDALEADFQDSAGFYDQYPETSSAALNHPKSANPQPAERQSVDRKPIKSQPAERQPVNPQPTHSQPVNSESTHPKPASLKPAHEQPNTEQLAEKPPQEVRTQTAQSSELTADSTQDLVDPQIQTEQSLEADLLCALSMTHAVVVCEAAQSTQEEQLIQNLAAWFGADMDWLDTSVCAASELDPQALVRGWLWSKGGLPLFSLGDLSLKEASVLPSVSDALKNPLIKQTWWRHLKSK